MTNINSRAKRRLRRLGLTVALVPVIAAMLAPGAGAADPTHRFDESTFADTLCGFTGTTDLLVLDNFDTKSDGSSYDSGRLIQTFTADNGRGVTISYDAGHEYNSPRVANPDGTTTLVFTYSGLNVKTQAVGGSVLQRNTGRIRVTAVLDADGHILSVSVVALAGPNPNLSGAPDCSVIGPYLAGDS
jgi:hypothetical protein